MREFFRGWRRKAGAAAALVAMLRLVFSWRLEEWCFETPGGYEIRHLWGYHPDIVGFVLLMALSASLLLWKPRRKEPPHA